jgi:hypothetical protein
MKHKQHASRRRYPSALSRSLMHISGMRASDRKGVVRQGAVRGWSVARLSSLQVLF